MRGAAIIISISSSVLTARFASITSLAGLSLNSFNAALNALNSLTYIASPYPTVVAPILASVSAIFS